MTTAQVFLSYSHADHSDAQRLAEHLNRQGIQVWWDAWEIKPGDSLIQRIFEEGLKDAKVFLVLLSEASVASNWVRHELDSAMVSRLNGVTRVVPVLKEPCEVPFALRSLKWVDLSKGFDRGIDEIVQSLHGVSTRPPLGDVPKYARELRNSIGGLSPLASTAGCAIAADTAGSDQGYVAVNAPQVRALMPWFTEAQINDAVEELEEYGLLKTRKWFGTAPYTFGQVEPTYALYLHFASELTYDPIADVKVVAAAIAATESLDGSGLSSRCSHISVQRLNRAISYLDDQGLIEVIRTLGTAPYHFRSVRSTRRTRQFVEENCR